MYTCFSPLQNLSNTLFMFPPFSMDMTLVWSSSLIQIKKFFSLLCLRVKKKGLNSSSKLYLYFLVKTPGHISESVSVTFNIRTIKKAYVREKNNILKKGNGVKVCKGRGEMQVKMLWVFFLKMWSEKHNMVLSLDFKWLILILLELQVQV